MGEIANDLIMNCAAREDSYHNLELTTFAVWQLAKMTLAKRHARRGKQLAAARTVPPVLVPPPPPSNTAPH